MIVLLRSPREAGAHEQAAALLARDPAAHAALDNPDDVARLLRNLREAGEHEQAAVLAARLSAAGMFVPVLEQQGSADQFRFGREADGTPAAPWGWEDLDLCLVLVRGDMWTGAGLSGMPTRVGMRTAARSRPSAPKPKR